MWKLQSQVGKQEREKEAWFDQTLILIPSENSHVDGDPGIIPHPHPNQCSASLFLMTIWDETFQKEEEGVRNSTTEIGTRRLHYVGSPLKILKNTKCGLKRKQSES